MSKAASGYAKRGSARMVRGSNDNAPVGEACVTDAGTPLPSSITAEELVILQPLISALARMVDKQLCAATLTCDPEVRRCA
jgi:hypothetical protein